MKELFSILDDNGATLETSLPFGKVLAAHNKWSDRTGHVCSIISNLD